MQHAQQLHGDLPEGETEGQVWLALCDTEVVHLSPNLVEPDHAK